MGKREDLIVKYAEDLKTKCGMSVDVDLLTKVTIGCGPLIYDPKASFVDDTQASELDLIKRNFLMKKLGLSDGPHLMDAVAAVLDTYRGAEAGKYRAVVYYMLTKYFGKESYFS